MACAAALALGSAVALGQPFPVYGETPTAAAPPDPAPAASTPADPAPAVERPTAREQELTRQVQRLRRQLLRERAVHRRLLRGERTRSVVRVRTSQKRAGLSEPVQHAIALAAATYGVSPGKLRRVATCESTLDPRAGSGPYLGLFQFGAPLWRATPYGAFERTDPYAAALAAGWAFGRGMHRHWPVCGSR